MGAAGLRDIKTNMYLEKPTEIWASDERLIRDMNSSAQWKTSAHTNRRWESSPSTHMDMGVCLSCGIWSRWCSA
eukprot:9932102-Prorocentrum_lima.AAC.1